MTKKELMQFAADLKKAEEYAAQYSNTEDGGTSNFDAPAVKLKATETQIEKVCKPAMKWRKRDPQDGKTWFVLFGAKRDGQGNRNTRMAEAISKKLAEFGYETTVYYEMD